MPFSSAAPSTRPGATALQAARDLFPDHKPGAEQLILAEGLLQTPAFHPQRRWISATVSGVVRQKIRYPGWAESALLRLEPEPCLLHRAEPIIRRMLNLRLGGACWADPVQAQRGDWALVMASGNEAATTDMINAAIARQPAESLLLVLPTASTVFSTAALSRLTAHAGRLGGQVVRGPLDPWSLLERAREVHAGGDDPTALLALAIGLPVHCHRTGLAAGWGVTTDAPHIRSHPLRRTTQEILAAVLLQGSRYLDPFTGQRTRCEDALELVAEWRRLGDANRRIGCLVGMSSWKRQRMAQFFHTGVSTPPIHRNADAAIKAAGHKLIAGWTSRIPAALLQPGAPHMARVEDGFVRSVGLGADFLPPCSIVVDVDGIYFDPSRPSGLERILAKTEFEPALLERARKLTARLVAHGITKYGSAGYGSAGTENAVRLQNQPGQRRILVPGQVADDLSVRLGAGAIGGNLELLQAVRAANPDAHIVYKPHPDVDAGHRKGALSEADMRRYADQVVRGGPMPALIDSVDEVHTMTSLAGFEALLRGRGVTCYGQPFYAGWGLTTDLAPIARRTRKLSLDELAAGALLLYPRYIDPVTLLPCSAEVLLDRLSDPAMSRSLGRASLLSRGRRLQGRLRRQFSQIWPVRPDRPAIAGGGGRA